MNYEEFKMQVVDEIKGHLPEKYDDADVRIQQVTKSNDTVLDGLMITSPESNISPNIYLNQFFEDFQNGRDMEDILEDIAQLRIENEREQFDISGIADWESAKENIVAKIWNAEHNQRYISDMPHTIVEDLAVTYHVVVDENENGIASTPIKNSLMENYGVSVEELHDTAIKNMNKDGEVMFMTMRDVMIDLMLSDMPMDLDRNEAEEMINNMLTQDNGKMFVLTNASKVNGAAVILNDDVRQMIADEVGGDFFVLPSSVHECLIVPKDAGMDYEELQSMVQDVNTTQVAPEERLSDHVYEYDAQAHEFMRSDKAAGRETAREAKSERADKRERPSLKEKLEAKKQEALETGTGAETKMHKKEAALS